MGFQANSTEAVSLYRGCKAKIPTRLKDQVAREKPSLVIIGAQKTGTTSLDLMSAPVQSMCFIRQEVHFWDQWQVAMHPPAYHVLRLNYFTKYFGKCNKTQYMIEKTPSLLNTPWVPRRMCQSLGQQRLMVLLRNPVKRALSGFYQNSNFWKKEVGLNTSASLFDTYAKIEVALVKKCPTALPTGDPSHDKAKAATFRACCNRVAKGYIHKKWPGCRCISHGISDNSCTMTGHRFANAIRRGLYAHWLRIWLQYHRPEDLLIFRAEDFFERAEETHAEMTCFAHPKSGCKKQPAVKEKQANSKATSSHGMWASTEQMLKDFYTPYNNELDALLGRKMRWW